MKTLFDKEINDDVCRRIGLLKPDSKARWGRMTVTRMLRHLNLSFDANFGSIQLDRDYFLSSFFIKPFARHILLGKGRYWRYMPAHRKTIYKGAINFYDEQSALVDKIKRYAVEGAGILAKTPHYILGVLTAEQSAYNSYKHVDHHLRQFGVHSQSI